MLKRVHGYVPGGVFWDLLGFADYVIAERPAHAVTDPASAAATASDPRGASQMASEAAARSRVSERRAAGP
jgi:hypothetical protein